MMREKREQRNAGFSYSPRLGELKVALRLIQRLARGPATLGELEEVAALHHRSVRRYLHAFEAVGLGVEESFKLSPAGRKIRLWWIAPGMVIAWVLSSKIRTRRRS